MKIWIGEKGKEKGGRGGEEGEEGQRKGDGMQEICEKDVGRSVDLIREIRAESRRRERGRKERG